MGYGHERAAFALRHLAANGELIIANNYPGIPKADKFLWNQTRKLYELVSRVQPVPVVGEAIFKALVDRNQKIEPFYPRRDLSAPSVQLSQAMYGIEKRGLLRDLIERLRKHPLPLVSTFFLPAFAAELHDYPEDIYVVVCDADIARVWAPRDPKHSRIKYFAPNGRVVERLKLYGVREDNIYLTGFPLPKDLVGGERGEIARGDLLSRICNLDPNRIFWSRYARTLRSTLGETCNLHRTHPLTLTFSVGGAGAQKRIAVEALKAVRTLVRRGMLRVVLVAGTKKAAATFFEESVRELNLSRDLGKGVVILHTKTRKEYFPAFTKLLRETDILWTKPSELSFYTGLGIPIIMAEPIGSQEDFNRVWLFNVGGGTDQLDPSHMEEWLIDWVNSGALARMAWNGFIEAPTHGAFRIEQIITGKPYKLETLPLIV